MFRSIRWRLVVSYTLMTILTVALVGVLALFLIERYLIRQERDFLMMGATTVAQQIEPFLRDPVPQPALQDWARTTALLSDVQVRILNADEQLLADSGQPSQLDAVTWALAPAVDALPATAPPAIEGHSGVFVQFLTERQGRLAASRHREMMDNLAINQAVPPLVVFRRGAFWGNHGDRSAFVQPSPPAFEFFWVEPASGPVDAEPRPTSQGQEQRGLPGAGVGAFFTRAWPLPQRVIQTVEQEGAVVGYVELTSDLDFGATALALIRRAFLLAGVGVSLLAIVVALWMSRTLTAPLQDLIQATNQMGSGALSARAVVRTQDEIGRLAAQFNTMATQLERSFAELAAERDALRRFVADASHELRTPITALKTFSELLLGPAGENGATRLEFVQESQKQVQRLEWITSALLKLSRLDAGLTELKTETVDLGELLHQAARSFVARAQEKAITLTVATPPTPITVRGNVAYLEMALANLLDNGLKFTPAGGAMQLGAATTTDATEKASAITLDNSAPFDSWAELWVQDNGLGIASADRPYIFDRFYRGQQTDMTNDDTGCGLGLAIVQSIAKAHGGQVTVQSEVGVGSRFVIRVPVRALN